MDTLLATPGTLAWVCVPGHYDTPVRAWGTSTCGPLPEHPRPWVPCPNSPEHASWSSVASSLGLLFWGWPMLLVCAPSVTGWPVGCCLAGWVVDGAGVVGWGVHMCAQAQPSRRDRTRGAPDQALGTSPGHAASFKVKLKESEKSKFEPGFPSHHESILVRAEREKTVSNSLLSEWIVSFYRWYGGVHLNSCSGCTSRGAGPPPRITLFHKGGSAGFIKEGPAGLWGDLAEESFRPSWGLLEEGNLAASL